MDGAHVEESRFAEELLLQLVIIFEVIIVPVKAVLRSHLVFAAFINNSSPAIIQTRVPMFLLEY